jgi:hypothetical protein
VAANAGSAAGAAGAGLLTDRADPSTAFLAAGALLTATAVTVLSRIRKPHRAHTVSQQVGVSDAAETPISRKLVGGSAVEAPISRKLVGRGGGGLDIQEVGGWGAVEAPISRKLVGGGGGGPAIQEVGGWGAVEAPISRKLVGGDRNVGD